MDKITIIGIDIAKNIFQLHAIGSGGTVVLRRQLRRGQVLGFFAKLDPCLIGLEACATSHYWAREFQELGHDVRLIPPIYVKPYVKRQKNDAADAEAICEAVQRPAMRFVAVKSAGQQGVLMLHRARELLVGHRTALINALRGHFAELGIVVAQGPQHVGALVQRVMEEEDAGLPPAMRTALAPMVAALLSLGSEIGKLDKAVLAVHRNDKTSVNLATIPGIGPLIASCLSASVPDARRFSCGREFAAYLGLVPKQNSTGGQPRLGRISKMGNRHLRTLLVVGAHAALYRMKSGKTQSRLADWARVLLAKKPFKLVAVALANKMARTAWAIMAKGTSYNPGFGYPLETAA
jgi:transposase